MCTQFFSYRSGISKALLTLGFACCGAIASAQDLRIATEEYYAPFNYFEENGELAGFDVDISMALCEIMQRDCR